MTLLPVSNAIHPTAAASTSTTQTATDYATTFMKLLTAELKSQDPTQTVDPTTMVTQMVQVNQLGDVAGIYSLLQQMTGSTTTTANASTSHITPLAAAAAQTKINGQ